MFCRTCRVSGEACPRGGIPRRSGSADSVSQATAAASQRQRPLGPEIIASARRALLRGSDAYPQKRSAYCGGASGVGGERAGTVAELGGCRAGAAPVAGLRADVSAAAPVVSCGGWGAAGSAGMILAGGIGDAGGKERLLGTRGPAAAVGWGAAAGGGALATGRPPEAGQDAAYCLRRASNGRSARFALIRPVSCSRANASHCAGVQPSRTASTCATTPNGSASSA